MNHIKEMKNEVKNGKEIKMSKAAKELNNAELGMNKDKQIQNGNEQEIVPISTDQMYTNFGTTDEKTIKKIKNQHEAAAITMAKQAVQSFVAKHPDSKFPELKGNSIDKANVEIDLETADFKSQINDLSEEQDTEPNFYLSVDSSANKQQLTQKMESADTSIPKWPSYGQPVQQFDVIKAELS